MDPLSREDILRALHALSRELQAEGRRFELIVVGGAALVLLYGARRLTRDVDALVPHEADRSSMARAAGRVAEQLDLPVDWLNDGAKGYVHGLALGDELLTTESLVVRSVDAHQLLAMKLCAWRDDVDIEDARLLLSHLDDDKEGVWRRLGPHLVPGRELKAQYALEDLWEAEHGHH